MKYIKYLRESKNLKQEDVANLLGIKRSTYTSYEIERDTIPLKHLNKLCNYFHISIDYALGLTNIKYYKNAKSEINIEIFMKRIKELRKNNKLSQLKIAEILNISRSTWTGYEYGKYQISTLLLLDIAKRYQVSIDFLLGKIDKNMLNFKQKIK